MGRRPDAIRFAVGSPEAVWSGVWRLWVARNDVFLGSRDLSRWIKVSLHSSGIWRVAWTSQSGIKAPQSADRVERRWKRPDPFAEGWTQGPSVRVPHTPVKRRFSAPDYMRVVEVRWFAPPARGNELVFTVLFSEPDVPLVGWKSISRPGDDLVGRLALRNHGSVWLLKREVSLRKDLIAYVKNFVNDMHVHPGGSADSVLGAVVTQVGEDDAGHGYLMDMALGHEHVTNNDAPTSVADRTWIAVKKLLRKMRLPRGR